MKFIVKLTNKLKISYRVTAGSVSEFRPPNSNFKRNNFESILNMRVGTKGKKTKTLRGNRFKDLNKMSNLKTKETCYIYGKVYNIPYTRNV